MHRTTWTSNPRSHVNGAGQGFPSRCERFFRRRSVGAVRKHLYNMPGTVHQPQTQLLAPDTESRSRQFYIPELLPAVPTTHHLTDRSRSASISVLASSARRMRRTRTRWMSNPTTNKPNPMASAPRSAYNIARPATPMIKRSMRFA